MICQIETRTPNALINTFRGVDISAFSAECPLLEIKCTLNWTTGNTRALDETAGFRLPFELISRGYQVGWFKGDIPYHNSFCSLVLDWPIHAHGVLIGLVQLISWTRPKCSSPHWVSWWWAFSTMYICTICASSESWTASILSIPFPQQSCLLFPRLFFCPNPAD